MLDRILHLTASGTRALAEEAAWWQRSGGSNSALGVGPVARACCCAALSSEKRSDPSAWEAHGEMPIAVDSEPVAGGRAIADTV
jgi:hypothetical protein